MQKPDPNILPPSLPLVYAQKKPQHKRTDYSAALHTGTADSTSYTVFMLVIYQITKRRPFLCSFINARPTPSNGFSTYWQQTRSKYAVQSLCIPLHLYHTPTSYD